MIDPKVSIVIPVYNGGSDLQKCLHAIAASSWRVHECIVVDDASNDNMTSVAADAIGARVIWLDHQHGPSYARNRGVEEATGDIVFFIDADVLVHSDTIEKGVQVLQSHAEAAAVFGSYDDSPAHNSFISKYRNLYHHWIHQNARTEASTFWTGCSAIRREVYIAAGGLEESFGRPSVEDIEFGIRLCASGYRIRLEKDMQCTHLKQWTLSNVIKTDVLQRGIPWMTLLLASQNAPNDLNINYKSRIATMLAGLLALLFLLLPATGEGAALVPGITVLASCSVCAYFALKPKSHVLLTFMLVGLPATGAYFAYPQLIGLIPLLMILVIVWTQLGFYELVIKKHNLAFALAVVPMQVLFFICCAISAALGIMIHFYRKLRGPDAH
jgi:cellulose synthase/poly-beta-1,6-N-acetylglucosamine synthase-like glycosyltransferase